MHPAFNKLITGEIDDFIKLLKYFLQTRSLRSLELSSEPVLQGIVECLLDPPDKSIPELCLVINKTKKKGEGRYGFIDIFIPPRDIAINQRSLGIILELKYITLDGLLKGRKNDWNKIIGYNDRENFEKELEISYSTIP